MLTRMLTPTTGWQHKLSRDIVLVSWKGTQVITAKRNAEVTVNVNLNVNLKHLLDSDFKHDICMYITSVRKCYMPHFCLQQVAGQKVLCLSSTDDANRMLTIKQEAHGPQFAHLTKNSYCILANAMQHSSSIATTTRTQIWPCLKKVKVILVSSFGQTWYTMSSQCCKPRFSLKASFVFFTIYGHCSHLVQWCRTIWINWQYPFNRRLHVKSGEN